MHTAELVGAALTRELDRMQASQGVDPHYMIKAQPVVAPDSPKQQISSRFRPLIGVLAIGAILLLLAVSAAEALETLRAEMSKRNLPKRDEKGDSIEGSPTNNGSAHKANEVPWEDGNEDAIVRTATNNSPPQKPRSRRKGGSRRKAGSRASSGHQSVSHDRQQGTLQVILRHVPGLADLRVVDLDGTAVWWSRAQR